MDGILLQSVEGLAESPFGATGGEIWEWLQAEKERVSREILADGPLCHDDVGGIDPSDDSPREIEWQHRGQLEARLREVNRAQDRLMDGGYGCCNCCGNEIERKRLAADPAVLTCLACQMITEGELVHNSL